MEAPVSLLGGTGGTPGLEDLSLPYLHLIGYWSLLTIVLLSSGRMEPAVRASFLMRMRMQAMQECGVILCAFLLLTFFTFIVYLSAGNNVPSDSLGMVHQQLIAINNLQILALLINFSQSARPYMF